MHLYQYLLKCFPDHLYELNLLKFEIEKQIYYYGNHFRNHTERQASAPGLVQEKGSKKMAAFSRVREFAQRLRLEKPFRQPLQAKDTLSARETVDAPSKRIVMKDYFNTWYAKAVKSAGYAIESPVYDNRDALKSISEHATLSGLSNALDTASIGGLLTSQVFALILSAKKVLLEFYDNASYKGLLVPYDIPLWERLIVDVFKELGKPTIVYVHGIPAIYNSIDYNRGKFILVWGEKIKANFQAQGVPASKIFVLGNPKYDPAKKLIQRPSSLEDVLLITKAPTGGQYGNSAILQDRGNTLLYLYMAQKVLRGLGVKSARFRPHPSEDSRWYVRNLDKEFYVLDEEDLTQSLMRSSLVIGPSSTVLFDSLLHGAPYFAFEPSIGGVDLINYPLVDPFNGANPKVPVAQCDDELRQFLLKDNCVDPDVFTEYCSPTVNDTQIVSLIED